MSLTPKENMLLVYQHKEPRYLPMLEDIQVIRTIEPGFKSVLYEGKEASNKSEVDWFGQRWLFEPSIAAWNPDASDYIVKDIVSWRDYVEIPDIDAVDWKALLDANVVELDKNKLLAVKDGYGLWERAFSMVPMNELLCALILEPKSCTDFFSAIADHKVKLHNKYIEYYKPDIFTMHDDYGSGQGLFMAPETWRELIKPQLQRVIDNITSKGIFYEHHCCGYLVPLAEEISDMGASSWDTVHVCNNPVQCKKMFGDKLVFMGGVSDTQYIDSLNTTEEQARKSVQKTIEEMLPGTVIIGANCYNHRERTALIQEELQNHGQKYFSEPRPV